MKEIIETLKHKIDNDGLFIEDVFTSDTEDNLIGIDIPEGFMKPKWDGNKWVENDIEGKKILEENNKILKIKEEKKLEIGKIATLTDQLNLISGLLADQVLVKAEGDRTELENKALQVYKGIQAILNK